MKVVGTCNQMCPESEIRLRERENLLHPFERGAGHTSTRPKADRHKCVKEYKRQAVGSHDVRSGELRPPDVLASTVDYLIDRVTSLNVDWADIYDFVFDRLRSVRQDLVMQQCENKHAIAILERAVRFHVYSDYRLCMEHISRYDPSINNQHTQECLKRLITFYKSYEGLAPDSHELSCRPEFEATYLLFNLGEEAALKHYLSLDDQLRNHRDVRAAYETSCAYLHNNWVRLLRRFKQLNSPIHLCAVHRHFTFIQRKALYTMNAGYSSKNLKFPLEKLTALLLTNTDTETQQMCQTLAVTVLGTHVQFLKGNFKTDEKLARCQSDFINERLRKLTVPDILHGRTDNLEQVFAEKCAFG